MRSNNKKLYFAIFTITIIVAILGGAIWAGIIPLSINNQMLGAQTIISYAESQVALMKQRDWLSGGIGTYTNTLKLGGSDFGWRINRLFFKYDMTGEKSIKTKMDYTGLIKNIHIISANIVLTQIGSEGTVTERMTIGVYRMYPDYIACNKDTVWVDENMYQSSIPFQTLVVDDPLGYIDANGKNKVYKIDVTDELQNIFSRRPAADVYEMSENIFFQWLLKCVDPPESSTNDLKMCMNFACTDYLAKPNGPWSPTDPKLEIEWEYYPTCDVYVHINPSSIANVVVDKDLPPYIQYKLHDSNWIDGQQYLFDSNHQIFNVGENIDFRASPQTFIYNGKTYTMNHIIFGGTEYTQTFNYTIPDGVSRIDLTVYYFDNTKPMYKVTIALAGKGGYVDQLGIHNNVQKGTNMTLFPVAATGYKFDYITANSIKIDGKVITVNSDLNVLVYFTEDNIITKLLGEYLPYEVAGLVVIVCIALVLNKKIVATKGVA